METILNQPRKLRFTGEGGELLGIFIVNWILCSLSLGLYYPWAKAKLLQYLYRNTELEGSRFSFTGTGKEMFWGFVKAVLILGSLYAILIVSQVSRNPVFSAVGALVFLAGLLFILPVALHGGLRYRLAKTSWRNIHFGYRGDRKTLIGKFIGGSLLSFVTAGLYGPWFATDLRRYMIGHIRFGSLQFHYKGNGGQLFWINFKGMFLSIITLGIYFFWYMKEWMNHYVNNIELEQDGQRYALKGTFRGGSYFGLVFVNMLLVLFTLGLGIPWAMMRSLRFFYANTELPAAIDLDKLQQTEEDYSDATGADMVDMMDIGII